MRHQPKGEMCLSCTRLREDCSMLSFDRMRVIDRDRDNKDPEFLVVRCDRHERRPPTFDELRIQTRW